MKDQPQAEPNPTTTAPGLQEQPDSLLEISYRLTYSSKKASGLMQLLYSCLADRMQTGPESETGLDGIYCLAEETIRELEEAVQAAKAALVSAPQTH